MDTDARGVDDRFFDLSIDMLTIAHFSGFLERINPAWDTTAAFSLIDALLLKPLRYPNPDRLYAVHEHLPHLTVPVVAVNALH